MTTRLFSIFLAASVLVSGCSDKPPAVANYNIRELAADIAGIAGALGETSFKLVGHDWGCIVAWNTALLHEDTVSAVMGLSVPFWRLGPASIDPPGMDDRFWYIRYFQEGASADADFEADASRRTLHTQSGAAPVPLVEVPRLSLQSVW